MPIVFLTNYDIYLDIYKLNNTYTNIYHFYADLNNKEHFQKANIEQTYCVILLSDIHETSSDIEDGFAFKTFKMIE